MGFPPFFHFFFLFFADPQNKATMERCRKLRTSEIVALVLSVSMWGVVAYILHGMVQDYLETGRKEKTSIEQSRFSSMQSPWLLVASQVGQHCSWSPYYCEFSPLRKNHSSNSQAATSYDCLNCYQPATIDVLGDPLEVHLFNATCLHALNVSFKSQLDSIHTAFAVVDPDGYAVIDVDSCYDYVEDRDAFATTIPVGDEDSVQKLQNGSATIQDFGAPVYVADNHYVPMSFEVSQEEYSNGRLVNHTSFSTTQFALPKHWIDETTIFYMSIYPSSFTVQRVIHTQGESLGTLLGGMFGWIEVFTGACVQGLIMSSLAAYKSFEKRKAGRAKREKVDDEVEDELYVELNGIALDTQLSVEFRMKEMEEEIRQLKRMMMGMAMEKSFASPSAPSFSNGGLGVGVTSPSSSSMHSIPEQASFKAMQRLAR